MRSLCVVEGKVVGEPVTYFADRRVPFEVHVLVLHRAPQAFGEDIVHAPAASVHTVQKWGQPPFFGLPTDLKVCCSPYCSTFFSVHASEPYGTPTLSGKYARLSI